MENEMSNSNSTSSHQTNNDRQTVQVIQQALTRQPNTAAQYLQQMYAAQQQHLMLQTAALQQHQQHMNSAQLQSLAAAHQASIAVTRAAPAVKGSQQGPSKVTTINLTNSPQIIQRPPTVSSTPTQASGITQQAVLLGNSSSPALSASQAQMYLRAQMLIFTPAATVSSIQSDVSSSATSSQSPSISTQVQNLTVRGTVGETGGLNPSQLATLAMKPATATLSLHPVTKTAGCVGSNTTDNHKKRESPATDSQVPTGRTAISTHAIITPAFSPQLTPEPKPLLHQFVIQNPPPNQPRSVLPLTQPHTHQPQVSQGLSSPPITSQAPLVPPSLCVESDKQKPGPTIPVAPQCPSFGQQDGVVQCRLLPPNSAVIFQIPSTRTVTPPLQDNLQKHCEPQRINLQPSTQMPGSVPTIHATGHNQGTPQDPNQAEEISSPLDMTSGNGSSPLPAATTGSTPQNGESRPPQAVVKPQILTHVIEGFVIQEGAQPFPSHRSKAALEVGRSSLLVGSQEKGQQEVMADKLPQQDITTTTDSDMEEPNVPESKSNCDPPKLKCELCGRVDFEYKFKRSKRFCSMACAKRYNVGCTKRVGLFHPDRSKLQKPGVPKHTRRRSQKGSLTDLSTDCIKQVPGSVTPSSPIPLSVSSTLKHTNSQEDSSRCSDNSSYEEPLSPISASSSLSRQRHQDMEMTDLNQGDTLHVNHNFLPNDPTKWNVEDVYEFIHSLPGCQEISEEFRAQEIDGQALLLLKEDHLMSTMNIKLGPALKIYARISMLKDP